MTIDPAAPKVFSARVSGRELYVCDDFFGATAISFVANYLNTLHYARAEHSIAGTPVSGASAQIDDVTLKSEPFFAHLLGIADQLFPGEAFRVERAYVNNTVYGDMYYTHRDCEIGFGDITLLYYANPLWKPDWGGETIYYNDNDDAQLAVTPRPGRVVAARGAILHRGGVPTRICYEERRTIAIKLQPA